MLPLLKHAADGAEKRFRDAVEHLAAEFRLSEQDRAEMLPSGTAPVFDNRVGWARTYLKQAGLLQSPRRGYFQLTPDGASLLATNPPRIDTTLLQAYAPFRDFLSRRRGNDHDQEVSGSAKALADDSETPEERLAGAYRTMRQNLELELLEQIRSASPAFFERLVVDVLVAMGYGGSRSDAGRAIGKSGDEGIDGTINEDKLGLDVIYVQAKKWASKVGRPEIQRFAGALQGQRAKKGVFITTSSFSDEALEYAARIDSKIILIDGERLVNLMFEHNVGVSLTGTYELKKLDSDYFEGG